MLQLKDVASIGGSNAIKTYIENEFNTNSNFSLCSFSRGSSAYVPSSSTSAGDSDNNYAYIVGGDHYPGLCLGRFSAETEDEVLKLWFIEPYNTKNTLMHLMTGQKLE